MTVVVTGGAGFIGSNFIFYMFEKHPDYRIVCIDKLTYAGNLSTLAPIMDKENFAIYDAVFGWTGDLNVLEPGKGYMYESKATETKIFYYPSGN